MYTIEFGHLVLSSFFTTSFSLFEIYLKKTVEFVDKINNRNPLRDDLRSGIIEKITKHLYTNHSIASAEKSNLQLKELKAYRSIRNAIVHSLNKINTGNIQTYLSYIKQFKIVFDNRTNLVRIEDIGFLEDFHQLILKYGICINKDIINQYQ